MNPTTTETEQIQEIPQKEKWFNREERTEQIAVNVEQETFLEEAFESFGSFILIGVIVISIAYMIFRYKRKRYEN